MGKEKLLQIYVVPPWATIHYNGILNFDKIHSDLRKWFSSHKYFFKEKNMTTKETGYGKEEVEFEWEAFRKVDDYVKFYIEVHFKVHRLVNVLVEENGKKIKKQRGEFFIRFKAYFKKNYNATFSKQPISEFARQLYEKYLIKRRLLNYEGKLWVETNDLIDHAKDILHVLKR
ncbi:MAG: hypothetical protein V1815_01935 [Candidatus Woesearchaeota archaeon]